MVALNDLQINSKTETQFLQIDYLLLVLSICGFGFVLICLIIVFFNKKMRNQDLNGASDFEIEARTINSEPKPFLLKPSFIQTSNDQNNSTVEAPNIGENEEVHQAADNDGILTKSNLDNDDLNDFKGFNNSQDVDEQYNKFNDDFFTLMYPQLSLFNILHSPKPPPARVKPTISITEITSDDELNEINNMKNNCEFNGNYSKNLFNFTDLKIPLEKESVPFGDNSRINPFNNKDDFISELGGENLDLRMSPTDCNICEMNNIKDNLDNESSTKDDSKLTIDSDEDSDFDTTTSESMESSDSSDLGRMSILKPQASSKIKEDSLVTKKIQDHLPTIKSPPKNMEYINKELSMIDEEIKSLPHSDNLNVEFNAKTEIENNMSERFETLQKDISTFLKKTEKFESKSDLLSIVDQGKTKPTVTNTITSNVLETDNIITTPQDFEREHFYRNPLNQFLKSAGDNIHQDQLLAESSDQSSFSWTYRNIDLDREPLIPNVTGQSSDSLDYPKDSLPISNATKNRIENSKETGEETQFKTLNQMMQTKSTHLLTGFPFGESTLFNSEWEEPEQGFDRNSSQKCHEIKGQIVESDEANKDNTGAIEDKVPSNEELRDFSVGLDDSQSSIDVNLNGKFVQQTNKNAVSTQDSDPLQIHHFRGGNVQETLKLFENVLVQKKKGNVESQIKS